MKDVLPVVLSALVSLLVGWWGFQASRAAREDADEARREALRVTDQGTSWGFLKDSLEEARRQITQQHADLEAARVREQSCFRRVHMLERLLAQAGQDVPNGGAT